MVVVVAVNDGDVVAIVVVVMVLIVIRNPDLTLRVLFFFVLVCMKVTNTVFVSVGKPRREGITLVYDQSPWRLVETKGVALRVAELVWGTLCSYKRLPHQVYCPTAFSNLP